MVWHGRIWQVENGDYSFKANTIKRQLYYMVWPPGLFTELGGKFHIKKQNI